MNAQRVSSSGLSQESPLIQWVNRKRISLRLMLNLGVKVTETTIAYPRMLRSNSDLVGYKMRDLLSGKQWNEPSGISIEDTIPFTTRLGERILFVCEGESDALSLASNIEAVGIAPTIVACPGASAFPSSWAGLFANYDVIYVVPDADDAGERLADRVCSLLPRTRHVLLPAGMDLCDVIVDMGVGALMGMIQSASHRRPRVTLKRIAPSYSKEQIEPSILVDLLSADTHLRRNGSEYRGLCPLHREKTPSLSVDTKRGLFYCHGCQNGGDAIRYLQLRDGLDFKEALKKIKEMECAYQ